MVKRALSIGVLLALTALLAGSCGLRNEVESSMPAGDDSPVYCVEIKPGDACRALHSINENSAVVSDRAGIFYCVRFPGKGRGR